MVAQEVRGAHADFPAAYLRETLLLDPGTGFVPGYEDALFGSPLKLNLNLPAALSVRETLERGTVGSVRDRP